MGHKKKGMSCGNSDACMRIRLQRSQIGVMGGAFATKTNSRVLIARDFDMGPYRLDADHTCWHVVLERRKTRCASIRFVSINGEGMLRACVVGVYFHCFMCV